MFNATQPSVSSGRTVMFQTSSRGALLVGTGVEALTVRQGDPGLKCADGIVFQHNDLNGVIIATIGYD